MCKNFSYDDIQKWLKWFCELNIYNHFKEIFNFFFHPMIFWTHYDKMSAKDKIVQFIHYMPFGEMWYNQQASAYNERFKFTGKERDSESKYDYFGARYYASTLPAWLTLQLP